jgi:hypothetical protein
MFAGSGFRPRVFFDEPWEKLAFENKNKEENSPK